MDPTMSEDRVDAAHAKERYHSLSDPVMVQVLRKKVNTLLTETLGLHRGVTRYITSSG